MFEGRLWEARALLRGCIELAEQIGSSDLAIRSATTLANITALDDPSEAVAVQREIIVTARRLGHRALEINTIGNVAEDARRTGDWDWAVGELETARQYELDDAGEIVLDQGMAMFQVLRGEVTDDALELLAVRLSTLEDVDVEVGKFDLRGLQAFSRGDFGTAADEWIKGVSMSDYNVPYILPRVAVASILARRPDGAAEAIRALIARGTRGRSIDADRLTIEAGIAALAGDREAALAGYRAGLAAYRDLSLQVDEAFLALQAATRSARTTPRSPAGSTARRTILVRLRAHRCSSCSTDRAAASAVAQTAPRLATAGRGGVAVRPDGRSGEGVEPGDHVPAQRLDDLRVRDVPGVEDHVLRAGVRELPEPVDDLRRRVARPVVDLELHASGASSARSRRGRGRSPRSARAGPRTCGGSAPGRRTRCTRRRTGPRGGASSARRRPRS